MGLVAPLPGLAPEIATGAGTATAAGVGTATIAAWLAAPVLIAVPSSLADGTQDAYEGRRRGQFLVRFGQGPESAARLGTQAAAAEAAGLPHGVSTRLVTRVSASLLVGNRIAPLSVVEAQFPVVQTGANPNHYTVVLPKPVTEETAEIFNGIFVPR